MGPRLIDDSQAPPVSDVEQSLGAFWQQLSRRATDAQLALCAAVMPLALVVALVVTFTRPHWATRWWPATAVPLLVGAFGLWGIADRERDSSSRAGWRVVQGFAVVIAIISAAVLTLWFLERVVGTWNL